MPNFQDNIYNKTAEIRNIFTVLLFIIEDKECLSKDESEILNQQLFKLDKNLKSIEKTFKNKSF